VIVAIVRGYTVESVKGYYKCIRCGSSMVTLLWTKEEGRLIVRMEPLICPACATEEERREASKLLWKLRYE
jgi:DNA-directed RNA polymerase subunit RPC12/RpoP